MVATAHQMSANCPDITAIATVAGPVAHSIGDFELWMKLAIDTRPWEVDGWMRPGARSSPRLEKAAARIIMEDAKHALHPSALRAMMEALGLLEAASHEVIQTYRCVPELTSITLTSK
jgi:hypothetical protein